MQKKRKQIRNIALCVPQPLVEHKDSEEGLVTLLVPRFRAKSMQWLQARMKSPFLKVRLDEIGSAAWKLMDNKKTIVDIGVELEKQLGEKVQPVHERLGLFFGSLKKNSFVTWEYVESSSNGFPLEPK